MNRPPEREALLWELIEVLLKERRERRESSLESRALAHPELAEELREVWSAALIAEELAPGFIESGDACETAAFPHAGLPEFPDRQERFPRRPDGLPREIELIAEVGRGGMGIVYVAHERSLERKVAVKVLRHGAAGPAELARFREEAKVIGSLSHPNIVALHAAELSEPSPYLVMQYVQGTTLAKRLEAGPLSNQEAASLLLHVCGAISHAHRFGVLHRDLKPSNILLDQEGRPYVSDFGLAKRVGTSESLTQSGTLIGTPSYMAPEQAAEKLGPIGPVTDVYGLGAILYQTLTGRPPFLASSALDTLRLVLEQDPVWPRALNPRVNADLEAIALRCLEKSKELRYQTADDLAHDLRCFLEGEPITRRSLRLKDLAARMLGETQHADVVENWGGLWMLHSVALVLFCGVANVLLRQGVKAHWPYLMIFTVGMGFWASAFWAMRRRGGPIRYIERLMAHVWGAGIFAINLTFVVEMLLGFPPFKLAPVFGITNGMLFMIKGGILSGWFYLLALAMFASIPFLAWYPENSPAIFGAVAASCFFVTGWNARRRVRRRRALADSALNLSAVE